ncbi:MAG: tetratricopeptide repeat protein [Thermodesulfobacteriota bacterium]
MAFLLRHLSCLFVLTSLLTLSACGGKKQIQQPPPPEEQEVADLSCAYFYFLWGKHAENQNKLEEAREAYEKALVCDPEAEFVAQKLPILLIRMDQRQEAVQWLEETIQQNPEDRSSLQLLARLYINEGRYDEAIELYQRLRRLEPANETTLLRLGYLFGQKGDYQAAEQILQEILVSNPSAYFAHLYLARIAVKSNDAEKAAGRYETCLKLNYSAELISEMIEFYGLHKMGDRVLALHRLALNEEPENEQLSLAFIQVYFSLKQPSKGMRELVRLRSFAKDPDRIDIITARIYISRDRFNQAIPLLQSIVSKGHHGEAEYMLAALFFDQKNYDKSLNHLKQLRESDKQYPDSIYLRVRILKLLKKEGKAFELLEQITNDSDRRRPEFFSLLASMHMGRDEFNKGYAVLKRALVLFPDNELLYFEYGLLLDKEKKTDEAITWMKKVLVLNPDNAEALNYIGYTWADANRNLDQALSYIRKAVAKKPENGYIRDSLGWVYYRLGEDHKAEKELKKALQLEPTDPHIFDHLGDVLLRLGNTDTAIDHFRKAVELFEDAEKKQAVQEKLRQLEK